jgi:TonB family protein
VSPPKALYAPDPDYSDVARQAKYQGTVVLWLIVTADGLPANIRIQQGIGMGLDQRAVEAVKLWRFDPAKKDGEPVPVMINVEINFRMDNAGGGPPLHGYYPRAGTPPRFSGVDTAKYPLVINVGNATGIPAGNSYEINAKVTVEGAESRSLVIACSGKKKNCSFLGAAYYPARWLDGKQRLEILGLKAMGSDEWIKTEYSIAAEQNSSPAPQ